MQELTTAPNGQKSNTIIRWRELTQLERSSLMHLDYMTCWATFSNGAKNFTASTLPDQIRTPAALYPAQIPSCEEAHGTTKRRTAARLDGTGLGRRTGAIALGSVCPLGQPRSGSRGPSLFGNADVLVGSLNPGSRRGRWRSQGGSLNNLAFQGVDAA